MSSDLGQRIYDILKAELSEITSSIIVKEKCKAIGKTPDTITSEDIQRLIPLIMGPALLFGGKTKSQRIKEKLQKLI
ncbi:MAG: hypothetical protein KAJ34_06510 [Thermodesulfovibrionia bacterium]|nr:hypothetical protein [Thermodesulfovibrionia bacterium]MCK5512805.1 hypothetical protein [Thermodesulfovibrionia bacterium]